MDDNITRQEIDDFRRRNSKKDSYKNRIFNYKRSTNDEYTGEKLYYSSKGKTATVEQPRHYSTEKTANVDHVVPIDQMIDKYGGVVSKEQLRRITNSDYNLAVTSEARNKSKLNMSNHEYLYKKFKNGTAESITTTYNMLQNEATATVSNFADVIVTSVSEKTGKVLKVDKKILRQTTNKIGDTTHSAVNSGTSAALMSLATSSINNITFFASGEKDLDEALRDVGRDAAGSFVGAEGLDLTQQAISDILKHCRNSERAKMLSMDLPIAEISTIIMVGNSVIKYISDDITAEECVTEILMNGAGAMAYSLGMVIGGPAGAIISSVVVAQISITVLEYKQAKKLSTEKECQINHLVGEALIEMEKQRKNLQQMINEKYTEWDVVFDVGFKQIFVSAIDNNVDGITEGLNTILCIFNERAKFCTINEFNLFFDDSDSILVL